MPNNVNVTNFQNFTICGDLTISGECDKKHKFHLNAHNF